jgi:hypothetical protein
MLKEFTIDEGCEFLTTLLPNCIGARTDMETICTNLGGLPIALRQAACYILVEECQISGFLKIYQNERKKRQISSILVPDYELPLSTVWEMSFSRLTESCRYVLEILAFLDPDGVPQELLRCGALEKPQRSLEYIDCEQQERLRSLTDEESFEVIIQTLRRQSLIRINPESRCLAIHRLLQENAFERLDTDKGRKRTAFADTLFLLSQCQPQHDSANHWSPQFWEPTLAYLPHVLLLESRYQLDTETFRGLETLLAKLLFNCAT